MFYLTRIRIIFLLLILGLSLNTFKVNGQEEHQHEHHFNSPALHEVEGLDSIYSVMEILTVLWVFAFAASIGSFLNVVIYRMPLGMNLSRPKSHCPKCQTSISTWDNLPIIGWLKLRGKCRTCKCDISPRYPLVEAAVGMIALIFFMLELLPGCINLPHHAYPHHVHSYMSNIIWEMRIDLMLITFCHAYLVIMLLVLALISLDEMPIPSRLLTKSHVFILLIGLIFPDIYPVAFHEPFPFDFHLIVNNWLQKYLPADYNTDYLTPHANIIGESIINWGCGTLLGVVIGTYYQLTCCTYWTIPKIKGVKSMFLLIGAFLGWQAVISIFVLFELLRIPLSFLTVITKRIPTWCNYQIGIVMLTLLFILNWNTLSNLLSIQLR